MGEAIKYKGLYIVNINGGFRVKDKPEDSFALHHGRFETIAYAKKFIDKECK